MRTLKTIVYVLVWAFTIVAFYLCIRLCAIVCEQRPESSAGRLLACVEIVLSFALAIAVLHLPFLLSQQVDKLKD